VAANTVNTSIMLESKGTMVTQTQRFIQPFTIYRRYPYWSGQHILLWVKTGYSSNASQDNARVVLNGNELGRIPPRPWVNHNLLDYDVVVINVNPRFFNVHPAGLRNDVEIFAPPGNTGLEYVLLGRAILYYEVELQPSAFV
jgi:hypothetical protein